MSTLATWARFREDDLVLASAGRPRATLSAAGRLEPWLGGCAAALVYLLVGVFVIPRYGEMVDTVARTANAFYVLFSRHPHLAAIGFVWTPLPSLLALPLVALKNVWPGLVQDAVALNIVSALFGGLAVFFVLRMLRRLNLPGAVRWALAALLTLNPFVVFYATNGMTDMMMAATLLGAIDGLWSYLEDGYSAHQLAVSGLWMAIGFFMRYELIPWALVVAGVLAVGLARLPRHERPAFGYWHWMGGVLLVWLTPLGYAVALWLFFNWTIMHNPFYFQHGAYGNDAAVGTGAYLWGPLEAARGHIVATLAVVGRQTAIFPPVVVGLVGLLAYGLWGRHERHTRALVVMAGTLGVPLLHVMLVYIGSGDPLWLRFFVTFIPFGIVSIAYTARLAAMWKTPRVGARARGLIWMACIVGVAAGDGLSGYEFFVPAAAPTHFEPLSPVSVMTGAAVSRFLNAYLNAHPRFTVLADSWQAFPVLLSLQHPERVVTTSDPDFKQTLDSPIGRVNAFLVPAPNGASKLDAVDRLYPNLWARGTSWAHLIADFPGGVHFRLYAIGAPGRVQPATTHTPTVARCAPDHARLCGGLHRPTPHERPRHLRGVEWCGSRDARRPPGRCARPPGGARARSLHSATHRSAATTGVRRATASLHPVVGAHTTAAHAVVLTPPDIATFAMRQRKGQRHAIWPVRHAVHVWLQGRPVASSGATRVPAGASWPRLVASNDVGSRQRLLHLTSPVPPAPPRPHPTATPTVRPTATPTPRPTVRPTAQSSRPLIARPAAPPRPTATPTPRPTETPTTHPTTPAPHATETPTARPPAPLAPSPTRAPAVRPATMSTPRPAETPRPATMSTPRPTVTPTPYPTATPTPGATTTPTLHLPETPTPLPTVTPTASPTSTRPTATVLSMPTAVLPPRLTETPTPTTGPVTPTTGPVTPTTGPVPCCRAQA